MHKDCIILCHSATKNGALHCLQEIHGKTFLEYLTIYLRKFHICKVIFSISHKKEEFKNFITENRDTFYFAFDFAEHDEQTASGQAINHALQYSDTPDVLVMNGHTFFDVNIDDFIAWQQTKMGDVTLALKYQEQTVGCDTVSLNEENMAYEITEGATDRSGLILSGMYCMFRPSFLNINFPHSFSFENDYIKSHLKERDFIGMLSDGYFIDMSKEESLEKAQKDFPTIFKEKVNDDPVG